MTIRPISFRWSNLLICSWAVELDAIRPLLAPGLIPHGWCGSAYVSLVGLTVSDHRCAGVALHPRNFPQVNIRSYVQPEQGGPPGVLFIRQFIAHRLTAMAARVLWREPFHKLEIAADNSCTRDEVEYRWPNGHMKASASNLWKSPEPDSLEEFLTVRQWAYQPRRNPRRYAAEREPWLLNAPYVYDVDCDFTALTHGLVPNSGPPAPIRCCWLTAAPCESPYPSVYGRCSHNTAGGRPSPAAVWNAVVRDLEDRHHISTTTRQWSLGPHSSTSFMARTVAPW